MRISLVGGLARARTSSLLIGESARGRDSMYPMRPWQQNTRLCRKAREQLRIESYSEFESTVFGNLLLQHGAEPIQPRTRFTGNRRQTYLRPNRVGTKALGDCIRQQFHSVTRAGAEPHANRLTVRVTFDARCF